MRKQFDFVPNMEFYEKMEALKIDKVTSSLLEDVTNRTNAKYGTKLQTSDIQKIVESQFKLVVLACKYGDEIRVPHIGRIGIRDSKQKYIPAEDLDYMNDMQEMKRTGGVSYEVGY